ncbi:hypothetical protein [Pelagovum pacificum]|nr:hypothetical protein [Pelagovum pacificum]QQA43750.1 hypothetical protein I8N54_04010 [Pelagovum pacificum]
MARTLIGLNGALFAASLTLFSGAGVATALAFYGVLALIIASGLMTGRHA